MAENSVHVGLSFLCEKPETLFLELSLNWLAAALPVGRKASNKTPAAVTNISFQNEDLHACQRWGIHTQIITASANKKSGTVNQKPSEMKTMHQCCFNQQTSTASSTVLLSRSHNGVNGVCCPLFSVLSNPSWSRQMATLPEPGSARGFFLLKGSRSSPQSPHARSGREIGQNRSFVAICWFP